LKFFGKSQLDNITKDDVEAYRKWRAIQTARITKSKTKAGRRTLTLTQWAVVVWLARVAMAEGAYLFPHKLDVNKPMIKSNHAHDGALRRRKLPHFRLYDCRHTFATRAVESGVDLVTLAALLGHSKINMVMRYAHPTAEHLEKAIRKMEAFMMARQIRLSSR
jgi:integrase